MSKGLEAFNNILAEGDFRYFSSLYDIDMFKADIIAVKKELEALEIISKAYGDYANHKISEYELIMIIGENTNN